MIDFIDNYYADKASVPDDGYDMQSAKKKAVSAVLPLIIKNELTPKQGLCLKYYYVNKKSQREIAALLKLSQPTVSRHINTAKQIVNDNMTGYPVRQIYAKLYTIYIIRQKTQLL